MYLNIFFTNIIIFKLLLDKEKIDSQERIEGAKLGAKSAFDKDKLEADQQARGVELGLQMNQQPQE